MLHSLWINWEFNKGILWCQQALTEGSCSIFGLAAVGILCHPLTSLKRQRKERVTVPQREQLLREDHMQEPLGHRGATQPTCRQLAGREHRNLTSHLRSPASASHWRNPAGQQSAGRPHETVHMNQPPRTRTGRRGREEIWEITWKSPAQWGGSILGDSTESLLPAQTAPTGPASLQGGLFRPKLLSHDWCHRTVLTRNFSGPRCCLEPVSYVLLNTSKIVWGFLRNFFYLQPQEKWWRIKKGKNPKTSNFILQSLTKKVFWGHRFGFLNLFSSGYWSWSYSNLQFSGASNFWQEGASSLQLPLLSRNSCICYLLPGF